MSSKNPIIQALENEQLNKEIPSFGPGDTVVVQVKVVEGSRERSGKSARIKEKLSRKS